MEEYDVMALKAPFRILDIYLKHSIEAANHAVAAQLRIAEKAGLLATKLEGIVAEAEKLVPFPEYEPNNPWYP